MTETPPDPPREPQEGAEPPTPPQTPPEGSEGAEGSARTSEPSAEGEPNDVARLRRESARYRTERNEARAQVAALQRAEAERQAARLHDAGDLWTAVELADLVADDGTVDAEAVSAAVERLAEEKPHLAAIATYSRRTISTYSSDIARQVSAARRAASSLGPSPHGANLERAKQKRPCCRGRLPVRGSG